MKISDIAHMSSLGSSPLWITDHLLHSTNSGRSHCTVFAIGNQANDVPNILQAFKHCGNRGTITFPEDQEYWIGERINPIVDDVKIEWKGQWTLSDNLTYWRENSYPISFQNHAAGIVLSGQKLQINGHETGGINGNGDLWYTEEAGTTRPGRPMALTFWNITNVHVRDFFISQSPLWSLNIMNGTDMEFENIVVNNTATQAPAGTNWVQNTDGFDTMDTNNITLRNFWYKGGDDCIAIKPRSYNVTVVNVTCTSGNGIAIGSLGQYLEDSSVEDVVMKDLKVPGTRYGVYIKTWIGHLVPVDGYESCCEPRGGGWGNVHNLRFEDINVTGAARAAQITQDNGNNGSYSGTSLMKISDIVFSNVYGTVTSTNVVSISCSTENPCDGIYFEDVHATNSTGAPLTASCKYTAPGAVHGLSGCEEDHT